MTYKKVIKYFKTEYSNFGGTREIVLGGGEQNTQFAKANVIQL